MRLLATRSGFVPFRRIWSGPPGTFGSLSLVPSERPQLQEMGRSREPWIQPECETSHSMNEIGILGLGLMGTAMAERLLEAGYRVRVWNRTPEKSTGLIAKGAVWSDRLFAECPRIVVSLYSSEVVRVVLDPRIGEARPGTIVIDTTTGDPAQTIAMGNWLAGMGIEYLDAPISGSSVQTRQGEATVLVGAQPDLFERCGDLWRILGSKVIRCGPLGSASRMKLVSNLVLGLNRLALAEGLVFAEAMGIAPDAALEVLSASVAYSRVMDVKGRKMVQRDYAVQARLHQHLKDVRIILENAGSCGVRLPISEVHRQLLEGAVAAGLGDQDNSAIVEMLRPASPSSHPGSL